MKKFLTLCAIGIVGYFISLGCTKLQPTPPRPIEKENIISAYTDSINQKFILIGEKYHFVLGSSGRFSARLTRQSAAILSYLLIYPQTDAISLVIPKNSSITEASDLDDVVLVKFGLQIDKALASDALLEWVKSQKSGVVENGKELSLFDENSDYFSYHILLDGKQYKSEGTMDAKLMKLENPMPIMIEVNGREKSASPLIFREGNLTLDGNILLPLSNINYKD